MAFPSTALINLNEPGDDVGDEKIEDTVGREIKPVELLRPNSQLLRGPEVVEEEEDGGKTPLRYVPLCDVYSATTPCVSSISGGSKKVKPPHLHHHRKSLNHLNGCDSSDKDDAFLSSANGTMDVVMESDSSIEDGSIASDCKGKLLITKVYSRRDKGKVEATVKGVKVEEEDNIVENVRVRAVNLVTDKEIEVEEAGNEEEGDEFPGKKVKRRKVGGYELANLGVDSAVVSNLDSLQCRETRKSYVFSGNSPNKNLNSMENNRVVYSGKKKMRKNKGDLEDEIKNSGSFRMKRWIRLSFDGADPDKFVGLRCKIFWPLDADWYTGQVLVYDFKTGRHHVKYEDGDEEELILSNEKTKFHISLEEMQSLKLRTSDNCSDGVGIDVNELMVLAASLDDCGELEPGEIIWAKLTGYAMWPALILDESLVGEHKGLSKTSGEKSVPVQFFGTHDFARVKKKQVMSFLRGLLSSFHLKSKKANFYRSLEEATQYLREAQLPQRMLKLRNGLRTDDYNGESGEDEVSTDSEKELVGNKEIQSRIEAVKSFPFEVGDLQIINLGKVVKDSDNFQDEKFTWPEGYTALRRFPSISDPNLLVTYKMEVRRDEGLRSRPVFKVTSEHGEQFSGSTPSACWNKIYRRLRKTESEGLKASVPEKNFESGADMFGFSHPEISKLIKELATSTSRPPLKAHRISRARCQDFPVGYRPVNVKWKDLDKCNVCHMDEEYENNLFLQCDKCRIMVHARCYGESESMDGVVWLCNLCRPGAPEYPPPCCLCPITGGAMKPTTDGRWAHLACAIWIPETCLFDITKMEPIDGLSRINKDRWKLLCSICGVAYGACIQCSNHTCRVAYHPLCARAAGFCVELEDEDRLHLISPDEDDEDQCIRLLSFCKRHRPLSNDCSIAEDRSGRGTFEYSDYSPPLNLSGCARAEPYNFERRGRKEPEGAASLKRLYVENRPHLVGGSSQHDCFGARFSAIPGSRFSVDLLNLRTSHLDASRGILSVAEKYRYMRETFRKRLTFGKSGIHGFGIFAKQPHRAGDMVIEYSGELVRPSIADRREHMIYNSLVGAGTYMFRIDDERVIDATRAGSIAHLINHSCEPNCYSRTISVNGDEHIIIFAKRDLKQWEELTYDYRFYAIDEQLACYCGVPRCRGVVNDPEAKERAGKLYVPRCELIDWKGE